jgi:hypothetical protein
VRCAAAAAALSAACQELPRTYSTAGGTGQVVVQDGFDRPQLGPNWRTTGPGVELRDGAIVLEDARNHPVWLETPLPDDFRIELDAWADSDEGDIKVEVAGDGHSSATSASYVASGYVLVFGGWNNSLHVIARRDEHGKDRVSVDEPKVEAGRRYHWTITRMGHELVWEVDGRELLRMTDPDPLVGAGHRHFAFNGWEARTSFDNLVIESLTPPEEG